MGVIARIGWLMPGVMFHGKSRMIEHPRRTQQASYLEQPDGR